LFAFVLGFTTILIGGMIFFSRQWGEPAGFAWAGICIVALMLISRRIGKTS
jgi:hypothetical protein